jgi:hypothetical protein
MPYLRSANPSQFEALTAPGEAIYRHGAEKRDGFIPLAFQVTSPNESAGLKALLPHALITHVNPQSFAETFNKKVERIQTRGGFVEQHWGDDLGEISVDQSTGAFVNMATGLSSVLRQRTIAWDRYRDLYDLYRNNGSVYDPFGAIVLQGQIMIMYDRGTYLGHFRSFSVEETDESPFAFKLSWTFKVVNIIYQIPMNADRYNVRAAGFQSKNQLSTLKTPEQASAIPTRTQTQTKAEIDANSKLATDAAAALPGAAPAPAKKTSPTIPKAPGAAPTKPSVPTHTPIGVLAPVAIPPGPIIPQGFEQSGEGADFILVRNPVTGETKKIKK